MRSRDRLPRVPAECWPPSYFVKEEMEARGWDADTLATMTTWSRKVVDAFLTDTVELDDQMARDLSEGFGISQQFWLNLECAYRRWLRHPKHQPASPAERGDEEPA